MLSRQRSNNRSVLYIGPWDAGQNIEKPVDVKPQCVLYIGPAEGTNYLNFTTEQSVLYIGPPMLLQQLALTPFPVVGGNIRGMFGAIAAQMFWVFGQPALGIEIASFEVTGILFTPTGTKLLQPLGAAFLGTGLLGFCGARVRIKPGPARNAALLSFHGAHPWLVGQGYGHLPL